MAAFSSSEMFSIFVRFHVVVHRRAVGDELRVALHHGVENAQAVGAKRRSGFRRLDDGIGQNRRLDLGRAPRELDVHVHAEPIEIRLGRAHQLGGDRGAFEILRLLEAGVLGRRQHPADFAEALLRVNQIGDRHERRRRGQAALVLGDPVLPREAAVEHAVGDVACHLLRANQHALDLGIVDGRKIRPRAHVDGEPRAREQLHGRVLQRSFR